MRMYDLTWSDFHGMTTEVALAMKRTVKGLVGRMKARLKCLGLP